MSTIEKPSFKTLYTLSTPINNAHLKEKNSLRKLEKLGRIWIKLTEKFLHSWTKKIEPHEKTGKSSRKPKNSLKQENNLKNK